MSVIEFEAFDKIPRWKREIIITEKIDGTNAQIYVPEDGSPLLFGSRNRWLTPESDNAGFCRWGKENEEALRRLGYGRHFGEWWGAGIQRRYGLDHKRFSLFNTGRWGKGLPEGLPSNVFTVPIMYIGPCSDYAIQSQLEELTVNGSKAAPGFKDPEGVVIFHVASSHLYKATIKDDNGKFAQNRTEALMRAQGAA